MISDTAVARTVAISLIEGGFRCELPCNRSSNARFSRLCGGIHKGLIPLALELRPYPSECGCARADFRGGFPALRVPHAKYPQVKLNTGR